jgi:hypothetical protein
MSTDRPDDDPTRALDDFVRRMRPAASPAPQADLPDLSDLSDLVARLHSERTGNAPRPRGGTLRNGQTWNADDVEDVPVVEVPRMPAARSEPPQVTLPQVDLQAEDAQAAQPPEVTLPPVAAAPPADTAAIDAALREARDFAASQWDADDLAHATNDWQPDLQALQLRRASHPRMLAAWQPGAWTGAVRQVFDSTTEFIKSADGSPAVETYPPHRLLLLWPPQRLDAPLLGRWPQAVRLSALPQDEAAEALLAEMPGDALLWLHPGKHDVDWALAAEIVLHHEPALRPFQIDGLRAFIAAEREASFRALNSDYGQPQPGAAVLRH